MKIEIIRDKDMHCPNCNSVASWIGVMESGDAKYYCPNCYYQWNSNKIHKRNLVKE